LLHGQGHDPAFNKTSAEVGVLILDNVSGDDELGQVKLVKLATRSGGFDPCLASFGVILVRFSTAGALHIYPTAALLTWAGHGGAFLLVSFFQCSTWRSFDRTEDGWVYAADLTAMRASDFYRLFGHMHLHTHCTAILH